MLFKNLILKSFLIGSLSFLSFHANAETDAVWNNDIDIVKDILRHVSRSKYEVLDLLDSDGLTALDLASVLERSECKTLILNKIIDI